MSKLHRYKVTNFHSHTSMPFFGLLTSFFYGWWCNLMKIKFIECKCVFACIIIMVKCFFLSCTNCLYLMKYEIYIATNLDMYVCLYVRMRMWRKDKTTASLLYLKKLFETFAATTTFTTLSSSPYMLHSLKYSCIIIFRVKSTT